MTTPQNHYTFGDLDLAAERLRHLAVLFEPSMLDFLRRADAPRSRRVVDLGCGPGYTTRTLWQVLQPRTMMGVDSSERFLARARAESPAEITYRVDDVTTLDLASGANDLAYSRFLLTHLPNPGAALSHWSHALAPAGRVLVQETADLASAHPALGRYYELVAELQRRHGQSLNIGHDLPSLVDASVYRVVSYNRTPLRVPADAMARLHAMNIVNWRNGRFLSATSECLEGRLQQTSR